MPINCLNTLTIQGRSDLLETIRDEVRAQATACVGTTCDFSLEPFIKPPETKKTSPSRELEHWCWRHWGTKWDAWDVQVIDSRIGEGHLEYFFRTAWTPPIPVIRKLQKRYPGVRVTLRAIDVDGGADKWRVDEDGTACHQEYCRDDILRPGSELPEGTQLAVIDLSDAYD